MPAFYGTFGVLLYHNNDYTVVITDVFEAASILLMSSGGHQKF